MEKTVIMYAKQKREFSFLRYVGKNKLYFGFATHESVDTSIVFSCEWRLQLQFHCAPRVELHAVSFMGRGI